MRLFDVIGELLTTAALDELRATPLDGLDFQYFQRQLETIFENLQPTLSKNAAPSQTVHKLNTRHSCFRSVLSASSERDFRIAGKYGEWQQDQLYGRRCGSREENLRKIRDDILFKLYHSITNAQIRGIKFRPDLADRFQAFLSSQKMT